MKFLRIFNFICTFTFNPETVLRKVDKRFTRIACSSLLSISKLKSLPRYLKEEPMSSAGIVESSIVRLGRYCLYTPSCFRIPNETHLSILKCIPVHLHHATLRLMSVWADLTSFAMMAVVVCELKPGWWIRIHIWSPHISEMLEFGLRQSSHEWIET